MVTRGLQRSSDTSSENRRTSRSSRLLRIGRLRASTSPITSLSVKSQTLAAQPGRSSAVVGVWGVAGTSAQTHRTETTAHKHLARSGDEPNAVQGRLRLAAVDYPDDPTGLVHVRRTSIPLVTCTLCETTVTSESLSWASLLRESTPFQRGNRELSGRIAVATPQDALSLSGNSSEAILSMSTHTV